MFRRDSSHLTLVLTLCAPLLCVSAEELQYVGVGGTGDYLESVIINLQLSAAVGCCKDNSKGSSVTASLIVRGELDSLDTALCGLHLYSDVTA